MDNQTALELAGVVFELRGLGDLDSEVAIFSDGHYDILSSEELTYLPAASYVYRKTGRSTRSFSPTELEDYYLLRILLLRPVLDRIYKKVSSLTLPSEGEFYVIPLTWFLG